MTALATTDDVEAVSRAVPDEDASKVERLLEMVSASVRGYTGQAFDPATDTITIHPHDGIIRLPQRPVTAVSEVQINGVTLAPTQYEFTANGYLRRTIPGLGVDLAELEEWDPNGPYDPTGAPLDEWGWAAVPTQVTYAHVGGTPDDIKMVVAEVTAAVWLTGDKAGITQDSETIAGYSHGATYKVRGQLGAWEPMHKLILDRYRRSGLASLRLSR